MGKQLTINSREQLKALMPRSASENMTQAEEHCVLCGEKKYPVLSKGRVMYVHDCKARLKSGKPLKGR